MKEGVRGHAGAENARQDGVADEAQNPGNHRDRADGGQRFEQIH
jgi:hypothetical protein